MEDSYGAFTCKLARLRRWRAAVPSARHRAHSRSARWSDSPPWRPNTPQRSLRRIQLNTTTTCNTQTHAGLEEQTENFLPFALLFFLLAAAPSSWSALRVKVLTEDRGSLCSRTDPLSGRSVCYELILLRTVPSDTCVTTVRLSDYKRTQYPVDTPQINIYIYFYT